MQVIRKDSLKYQELENGIKKSIIVQTENIEILNLCIAKGFGLKPHDMPCKVVFRVLSGEGVFKYGDEIINCKVGDMVHVNPGKLRYWKNEKEDLLELLVMKSLKEI